MQVLKDTLGNSHSHRQPEAASCLVQIHPLHINLGVVQLSETALTIGRDPNSDLQISDDSVSRQHAVIENHANRFVIRDRNSTNGVFVNDELVEVKELRAGDRIRCGTYIYRFLDHIEAQYHEAVYAMMTRDGLTGVHNKRYFSEILQRDVARARRRRHPLSLILLDIDHFKKINNTFGPLAGDEVLQELSSRIMEVTRGDELFARFGGEEFAVLVGDGDLAEARELAERCFKVATTYPYTTSAGTFDVTISMGVAEYDGGPVERLIDAADRRLYEAKEGGRNQIR